MKREYILVALFIIIIFFLNWINGIYFFPPINDFIKKHLLIINICSIGLMLFAFWKLNRKKSFLIWLGLGIISILFLLKVFGESMFLSQYEESIIKDLGNQVYVVKTSNPFPLMPLCLERYSIIKKHFIFAKKLYVIGCDKNYKINFISPNRVEVISNYTLFFKLPNSNYDTSIIDTESGELVKSTR